MKHRRRFLRSFRAQLVKVCGQAGLPALIVLSTAGCANPRTQQKAAFAPSASRADQVAHTFSVVAYDPDTAELGVAVQSKFFGVGTVVPWAKARVGAIATQSYANVAYGQAGLALLESGKTAAETVKTLTTADSQRELRQLGIVDAKGNCASYTGAKCNGWAGHIEGSNFCVQGNLLAGAQVVQAMAEAFQESRKAGHSELADWLMAALAAGQKAGGDKRGQQSAALLVVRENGGYNGANDRYIDLRVEDHLQPITELARLLDIHKKFYRDAHARKAGKTK